MTDSDAIRPTPGLGKSTILFTVNSTVRIQAPPKHVFSVITDFPAYSTWNSDTPEMTLQGPDPSAALKKGSTATMKVIMSDQNKTYDIPIEILQLESPTADGIYTLGWRGKMLPSWFATSERVQEIRPVDDDPNVCEVHNWESMAGWGAYVFKYIMGIPAQMKKFNAKYLDELKSRAESTWSPSLS